MGEVKWGDVEGGWEWLERGDGDELGGKGGEWEGRKFWEGV